MGDTSKIVMKYNTEKIRALGIDPSDLRTSLFCHWEMEKLDYHLDRMKIFDYLYKKEGRLDK